MIAWHSDLIPYLDDIFGLPEHAAFLLNIQVGVVPDTSGGRKNGTLKTPQSAQYRRNLGGVLDEFWYDGRSRGVAVQIRLYLLQECLSGVAALETRRPAVSKPINMVGEVLTTAI